MSFKIDVFTLFPSYIDVPCSLALLGKAQNANLLSINSHDIRKYSNDPHKKVDDTPYGGGPGMVMSIQPIYDAVKEVKPVRPLYVLSASGKKFDQRMAEDLSSGSGFSLICGRYEGIDQRVADHIADGEICVGDFVLGGGESAALCVIEAVTRLVDGVMGNESSQFEESFSSMKRGSVLEAPQYTRPAQFEGFEVPGVLLSGDHGEIEKWRETQSVIRTEKNRPDLGE